MKRRKTGILTMLIIMIIMVYAVVTLVGLNSKISAAQEQKAKLEQEASSIAAQNSELEYSILHSGEASTIQKIAREKLGFVMPGEIIFYGTNR